MLLSKISSHHNSERYVVEYTRRNMKTQNQKDTEVLKDKE